MTMDNAAVAGWKLWMKRSSTLRQQIRDYPNFWMSSASSALHATVNARLVALGSGLDTYSTILPAVESAQSEVILVTCFWAQSDSSTLISSSLRRLSERAQETGTKVRVRICCSSISIWQKLFHTISLRGRTYPPETWKSTFGLPSAHELPGLDLQIKSIFVLPFSVMHSKFVIIDRRRVFLPSCNVSWENWFEGCVELTGTITDQFVAFWQTFWADDADKTWSLTEMASTRGEPTSQALFLPSPHHALSLFDGFRSPTSPPTPLNLFLLSMLAETTHRIYLQTPNLTSRAVLDAILAAVARGVDVHIVTSERLMILEQIATARTTTARCVRWLTKQHQLLSNKQTAHAHDTEALCTDIGNLHVSYYKPSLPSDPVQSHIKISIADDRIIVLGSGNLDRASWVTSQELGVALFDESFIRDFRQQLDTAMTGRLKHVYPP